MVFKVISDKCTKHTLRLAFRIKRFKYMAGMGNYNIALRAALAPVAISIAQAERSISNENILHIMGWTSTATVHICCIRIVGEHRDPSWEIYYMFK